MTLKVYNIIGQEVIALIDDDMVPGYYEKTFNARGLSSGTNIFRLTADGGTGGSRLADVKKMVLIK